MEVGRMTLLLLGCLIALQFLYALIVSIIFKDSFDDKMYFMDALLHGFSMWPIGATEHGKHPMTTAAQWFVYGSKIFVIGLSMYFLVKIVKGPDNSKFNNEL